MIWYNKYINKRKEVEYDEENSKTLQIKKGSKRNNIIIIDSVRANSFHNRHDAININRRTCELLKKKNKKSID